jgi:hypothetical protein
MIMEGFEGNPGPLSPNELGEEPDLFGFWCLELVIYEDRAFKIGVKSKAL